MIFLCMAGTDIIGDNWLKIIHGRRKTEKDFRLGRAGTTRSEGRAPIFCRKG